MKAITQETIFEGGKIYAAGDEIELTEERFRQLGKLVVAVEEIVKEVKNVPNKAIKRSKTKGL